MAKTWTKASATEWLSKVKSKKQPMGLEACSAMDFLANHAGATVSPDQIVVEVTETEEEGIEEDA